MKAAIRRRAEELGFDDCRVTTANPPASAPQFQQWLAQRQHGEMAYLERNAHKRVDPQQVLPGARSIITLAVSYHTSAMSKTPGAASLLPQVEGWQSRAGVSPAPASPLPLPVGEGRGEGEPDHGHEKDPSPASISRNWSSGFLARYTRYDDYHDVLAERLKQLAEFVNHLGGPGTRSLWHVDTGPVLERDLAQRAGLGFIGKHTNLISRRLGNWLFLSEILTTLELQPDEPERNRCGSCTRCLTACPTAAITAPFQLDARRCISYLTIELKGPIPRNCAPPSAIASTAATIVSRPVPVTASPAKGT